MSGMSAALVRTFPPARQEPDWPTHISVEYPATTRPFCWSRNGVYVHRVRFTAIYSHHSPPRPVPHPWCGSGSVHAVLAEAPDPDRIICGTCHGRAIGAGQIDDEGTPLIFTPRVATDLGPCVYLTMSGSPFGGGGYRTCHRQAIEPIPEVPGAGLCLQHTANWPPRNYRYVDMLDHARRQVERRRPRIEAAAFAALATVDDVSGFWGDR